MSDRRVIVVGTTSDYIDLIRRRYAGRVLFVTSPAERQAAKEAAPDQATELLCDLQQLEAVSVALSAHLCTYDIEPIGITSYDCESMRLATVLAERMRLQYPSAAAIDTCRSKYATKIAWQGQGVPCPQTALAQTEDDVLRFQEKLGAPIVVKPLTGSGSELTFRCSDGRECSEAFRALSAGLARHANERMYGSVSDARGCNPRRDVSVEEFVKGPEFSCDFVVDGDRTEIIRVAEKIPATDLTFGTTLAYIVPARLPKALDRGRLTAHLQQAAHALGLARAFCMVDFILRDGDPVFLELTPRPGGDCLPPLVLKSSGVDTIGLALDFAEGHMASVPSSDQWRPLVGVRLFAGVEGLIADFDTSAIIADPRTVECYLKRAVGHRVVLPPNDYDSRLLGHILFQPLSFADVDHECAEMASKLIVRMEKRHDPKFRRVSASGGRAAQAADPSTRTR
jgi:biotin carboxylase